MLTMQPWTALSSQKKDPQPILRDEVGIAVRRSL